MVVIVAFAFLVQSQEHLFHTDAGFLLRAEMSHRTASLGRL